MRHPGFAAGRNRIRAILLLASPHWFVLSAQTSGGLRQQSGRVSGASATSTTPHPHTKCLNCHPHGALTTSSWNGSASSAASGKPKPIAQEKPAPSRGLSSECMVCHQGPRQSASDQATKLPDWTGAGSSHIDGQYADRAGAYVRTLDVGKSKKMLLRATCNGCHEIHAEEEPARLRTTAFDERGQVLQVKRTTLAQICFGCHAGTEAARLARGDSDIGGLFVKGPGSAHRPGSRPSDVKDLPSLRAGLFQDTLDCTSCHSNPNPTGPRGPHFSSFPRLLRAAYGRESDMAALGDRGNDLCFLCHEKHSILGNQSFPLHAQHTQGFTGGRPASKAGGILPQRQGSPSLYPGNPRLTGAPSSPAGFGRPTACATCHDPHGAPKSPSLIRFDPAVVSRASIGIIEFQRTGFGHGSCTLSCHGYDHVQSRY